MRKIIVADDHTVLVDAFQAMMRELDPDVSILPADSLDGALDLVEHNGDVDLVLLDYEMPGMHGLDGVRRLKQAHPDTNCAILSGHVSRDLVHQALAAGAGGFIPKTIAGRPLLQILRLLALGEKYVPPIAIELPSSPPDEPRGSVPLSVRERMIMELLRDGLSNKEIARRLALEEGTVKQHLRLIFMKLGVKTRTQAVARFFIDH